LNIVPQDQIASVWPQVQGWIKAALEYGQGDENDLDVLVSLACGRYLLWHEPGKFCGVVQVQEHPRQRVAAIIYAGGSDLDAMADAVERGKGWCRQHGISQIRVFGRKGWERVLNMTRKGVILQAAV
jgi:hypothetical protein